MAEVKIAPNALVPAIRFEGFSGEWTEQKLGEIATLSSGGTPSRKIAEYWNGTIPWVTTTLINSNIIKVAEEYITSEGLENSSAKIFPKNTLLMAMYGQGKTRGKVAVLGIEAATNQACAAIIVNNEVNAIYIFQSLYAQYQKIRELSNAGGQENLSAILIKEINLSVPKLTEQVKIGQYFQQLDTLIAQHQQRQDKLLNLKKSLLEKMFPKQGADKPAIRFKGFSGVWEEKELRDLTETSFTNGVFNDPSKVGRGYRLINVKDMYSGNSIDVGSLSLIDINKKDFLKNKVEYGDIFFTRSSLVQEGIAYSNVNLSNHQGLTFDGHLIRMQPCKKTTDPVFLSCSFKIESARTQFILGGKTTTMTTIGQNDIAVVKVSLPALEEQTKIGNLFQQLDTLITQHQTQLKKLNNIKQACLAKLFV